jgi:hypothetical protein
VARATAEAAAALYCLLAVRRLIGLSVGAQLLGPWRSFAATLVMASVVTFCVRCVDPGYVAAASGLQSTLNLLGLISVGTLTYGVAVGLLWLLVGRPHGIEAMTVNALGAMITKARRLA